MQLDAYPAQQRHHDGTPSPGQFFLTHVIPRGRSHILTGADNAEGAPQHAGVERKRPGYDWKSIFLQALGEVPVVSHAAKAAGIDRTTAYSARETDEAFAKAWDDAMEQGVDEAEAEAFRRAVQGHEEPVVYKGHIAPLMAPVFCDLSGMPVIDEITGTQKWAPVLDDQGRPVPLTVRKHSDALLTVILKGRRKKVYAEKTEVEHSGAVDVATTLMAARKRAGV